MAKLYVDVDTGICRAAWLNLEEPRDDKYTLMLLIDKKDTATLSRLRKAIDDVVAADFNGRLPRDATHPIRDPADDVDDDGEPTKTGDPWDDVFYVRTSTYKQPRFFLPNGQRKDSAIGMVQPGDYVRAKIAVTSYKHESGKRGVKCYLNGVQLASKGEALNLGRPVTFDAVEGFVPPRPPRDTDDDRGPGARGATRRQARAAAGSDWDDDDVF